MPGHPFERLSYDQEYDQALSYLYNLQKFGIKFGLSKTENLLKAFKHPQRHLKCIHIAGSNGKGSVAAMLASIYDRAGYKVGLFTSPHLIDFRERFQINGRMISKGETLALIKEIQEKTDPEEPPTFFEFVTAMALLFFYREKVDLAIMETGLGGRLDATNIIQPLITVITTISLEHQEYLGKTLRSIALEKGGIIKYQVPLVIGVSQKKVQGSLEGVCRRRQATMLLAGRDFKTRKTGQGEFTYFGLRPPVQRGLRPGGRTPKLKVGLLGDHQIKNAALALTVVQCLHEKYPLTEESIREGLQKVNWPGRLEVLSPRPRLVLDGAHNPEAMRTLSQTIPRVFSYKKLTLIFGMMKDKDIGQTLNYMIPLADRVFLTRAEYDRSADPEALRPFIEKKNMPCTLFPTVPSAIKQALKVAGPEDLILITGSLFIVGEARAWWERHKNLLNGC
ncbi:MAG: folylpolyglutamate synthase/dihydrofolate synthase family protein [Pseudomonadota bacterium]